MGISNWKRRGYLLKVPKLAENGGKIPVVCKVCYLDGLRFRVGLISREC